VQGVAGFPGYFLVAMKVDDYYLDVGVGLSEGVGDGFESLGFPTS
jgi:hypothetical protein